ncbi:MAG: DNA-3-methyladenine glycosylase [FCB group bacterium]|nr:DNA-3-methyladenine glycosylase [FCB group bacterium]
MTGFISDRGFFLQDVRLVARRLLGMHFVRILGNGTRIAGRIVETEAYAEKDDPASHSYRGRTPRNAVMFMPGGHLYVYFTYGMHYCCNVVTGPEGRGEAVLIRALEPLEGVDSMIRQRYGQDEITRERFGNLTNGPAKLCAAMGIDRNMNGTDLLSGECRIEAGIAVPDEQIVSAPRIGIGRGGDLLWRYYDSRNTWVSKRRTVNKNET